MPSFYNATCFVIVYYLTKTVIRDILSVASLLLFYHCSGFMFYFLNVIFEREFIEVKISFMVLSLEMIKHMVSDILNMS